MGISSTSSRSAGSQFVVANVLVRAVRNALQPILATRGNPVSEWYSMSRLFRIAVSVAPDGGSSVTFDFAGGRA